MRMRMAIESVLSLRWAVSGGVVHTAAGVDGARCGLDRGIASWWKDIQAGDFGRAVRGCVSTIHTGITSGSIGCTTR